MKSDETKLAIIRGIGFGLAVVAIILGLIFTDDYKQILGGTLVGLISWYVGKLFGEPLPMVTMSAIRSLPPRRKQIAIRILSQRPPIMDFANEETPSKRPSKSGGPNRTMDPK